MTRMIPTGIGVLSIAQGDDDVLVAQGLGSCIGIAAYEPHRRIAVLAHVLLPDTAPHGATPDQPARHAPEAVTALLAAVRARGGHPRSLVVKIAGGAQVLHIGGRDDRMAVGARNVEAVRAALARHNLPIAAEDTGGSMGRTMTLHAVTGAVTVRVAGGQERDL